MHRRTRIAARCVCRVGCATSVNDFFQESFVRNQIYLASVLLTLGLGVVAGAAPKRRLVPALPPLTAPASDKDAPADAALAARPRRPTRRRGRPPCTTGRRRPRRGPDADSRSAAVACRGRHGHQSFANGHSLKITTRGRLPGREDLTFGTPDHLWATWAPGRATCTLTLHFLSVTATEQVPDGPPRAVALRDAGGRPCAGAGAGFSAGDREAPARTSGRGRPVVPDHGRTVARPERTPDAGC